MKRKQTIVTILAVLGVMAILTACSGDGTTVIANENIQNSISVSGEGKVYVVPDVAEVVFGIQTEAVGAKDAKDKNTEDYNRVISFLREQGIEDASIKTANLGLNPIYDWSNNVQKTVGYTMQTDITVSDIGMDALGDLIDNAVNSGINYIQSVSYMSSIFDEKYDEAITLAIENAGKKADVIAAASNVTKGGVINVVESSANTATRYTNVAAAGMTKCEVAMDQGTDIQPGEMEITARVAVEYAIKSINHD